MKKNTIIQFIVTGMFLFGVLHVQETLKITIKILMNQTKMTWE